MPGFSNAPTIAECLERQDNFLLLRFVAASLVVLSHSYDTLGPQGDFLMRMAWQPGFNLGILAVAMFFFVSGFLVTGSYERRRNLAGFVRSRVLRLVPAYAVCLIGCAALIGPFATTLDMAAYWQDPGTRGYVIQNLGFNQLQWNLPGVFADNPHPDNVNASLWTLPGEVRMYLYVAAFGAIGVLVRRRLANLALAVLFALGLLAPAWLPLLDYPAHFLALAALFAGGAFCYVNRSWIRVSVPLALLLFGAAAIAHGSAAYHALALLAIGYACLVFAYRLPGTGFNRFGDYSYGIYLWNWPVQQTLWHGLRIDNPWLMFALGYPLVLLIAVLSWHAIERPMLRWKSRARSAAPSTPAADGSIA